MVWTEAVVVFVLDKLRTSRLHAITSAHKPERLRKARVQGVILLKSTK